MIKKIKIDQLVPGMFVHDLNRSWIRHPFVGNSTKVESEKTVSKIAEVGIKELYIDTDKGLDVADAPTREEVRQEIQEEMNKIAEEKVENPRTVSLEEEIVEAQEIKTEAKRTVHDIMEDIRFGKPIKTEKVEPVVERMIESIFRNQDALISIARIKQLDEYTYMHSMSVCVLMLSFGKHLGYGPQELKEVGIGAMLHDVGKMKIPLEILNKNKKLSDNEYAQMKRHVEYSNLLLEDTQGIKATSVIVASQHHERVDGTGYPGGIKGNNISTYGQAAAIADVYDAMTSQRCYQRRSEPTDVLKKLFEWSSHFNKDLVQHFVRCVGIYPVGALVKLESGFLAVVCAHNEGDLLRPVVRAVFDIKRDKFIYPLDVDLSVANSSDSIICSESQDKWKIRAERYIQEANKVPAGL